MILRPNLTPCVMIIALLLGVMCSTAAATQVKDPSIPSLEQLAEELTRDDNNWDQLEQQSAALSAPSMLATASRVSNTLAPPAISQAVQEQTLPQLPASDALQSLDQSSDFHQGKNQAVEGFRFAEAWLPERDCARMCSDSCECVKSDNHMCAAMCTQCLGQGMPCGTELDEPKEESPKPAKKNAMSMRFMELATKTKAKRKSIDLPLPGGLAMFDIKTSSSSSSSSKSKSKKSKSKKSKSSKKSKKSKKSKSSKSKKSKSKSSKSKSGSSSGGSESGVSIDKKKLADLGKSPTRKQENETNHISRIVGLQEELMKLLQTQQELVRKTLLSRPQSIPPLSSLSAIPFSSSVSSPPLPSSLAYNDFLHRLHVGLGTPMVLGYGNNQLYPVVMPSRQAVLDQLVSNLNELVAWVRSRRASVGDAYGNEEHMNEILEQAIRLARACNMPAIYAPAPSAFPF